MPGYTGLSDQLDQPQSKIDDCTVQLITISNGNNVNTTSFCSALNSIPITARSSNCHEFLEKGTRTRS